LDEDTRAGAVYRLDQTPPLPLTKYYDFNDMKDRVTGSGPPTAYSVIGDTFFIAPVSDGTYNFRIRCFKKDVPLTTNIENLWLANAEKMMLSRLGEIMARFHTHNAVLGDAFMKDYLAARNELILTDTARREAGGMRQMGDD
jgi:hypothetical protein